MIKTKSVKYMPFTLSLANFCNGIVWAIYALLKFDPNVLVSLEPVDMVSMKTMGLFTFLFLFADSKQFGSSLWVDPVDSVCNLLQNNKLGQ